MEMKKAVVGSFSIIPEPLHNEGVYMKIAFISERLMLQFWHTPLIKAESVNTQIWFGAEMYAENKKIVIRADTGKNILDVLSNPFLYLLNSLTCYLLSELPEGSLQLGEHAIKGN